MLKINRFLFKFQRQDYMFREMLELEMKLPDQIVVARKRLATIWGGVSLLEILLTSMKELLTLHEKWPWDYVINLSESDFPLK
jgi:protein xylosyltransferase